MALLYPDILKSSNTKEFGIVEATHVAGFRSVDALADLYTISIPILSGAKEVNTESKKASEGQIWHVNATDQYFRLKNLSQHNVAAGWEEVFYQTGSSQMASVTAIDSDPVVGNNYLKWHYTTTKPDGTTDATHLFQVKVFSKETPPTSSTAVAGVLDAERYNHIPFTGDDNLIPSTYLPSYVDDVLEGSLSTDKASFYIYNETSQTLSTTACTPEKNKIYVDCYGTNPTNNTFRYSGTQYTEISKSLALGDTSTTAFSGSRGKVIEDNYVKQAPSKPTTAEVGKLPEYVDASAGTIKPSAKAVADVVTGPASAAEDMITVFSGTTGKVVKNSAIKLKNDSTGKVALRGEDNNLTSHSNEFNFTAPTGCRSIHLNYRSGTGANATDKIASYILHDGATGTLGEILHSGKLSTVTAAYYKYLLYEDSADKKLKVTIPQVDYASKGTGHANTDGIISSSQYEAIETAISAIEPIPVADVQALFPENFDTSTFTPGS